MKRRDLIRHLESHGCRLVREGRSHSIYENTRTNQRAPVPRHREIPEPLVRSICRQLGIPPPKGLTLPLTPFTVEALHDGLASSASAFSRRRDP